MSIYIKKIRKHTENVKKKKMNSIKTFKIINELILLRNTIILYK